MPRKPKNVQGYLHYLRPIHNDLSICRALDMTALCISASPTRSWPHPWRSRPRHPLWCCVELLYNQGIVGTPPTVVAHTCWFSLGSFALDRFSIQGQVISRRVTLLAYLSKVLASILLLLFFFFFFFFFFFLLLLLLLLYIIVQASTIFLYNY